MPATKAPQQPPAVWRAAFSKPPAAGARRLAATRSIAAAPPRPSPEERALRAFLLEAGLQMYTAALLRTGFDDMETLAAIEDEDMKDLGMLPFHAKLLRRKVAELNGACVEEGLEVLAFLRGAGLERYAQPLAAYGFDDMEALLLIDDLDLKDIGVPRGHVVKLKKRLREYELSLDAGPGYGTPCQPPAPPARAPPAGRRPVRCAEPPCEAPAKSEGLVLSSTALSCIEASWEEVQEHGVVAVGGLLYKHVFSLAPQAMDSFPVEVRLRYREWLEDEDPTNLMESAGLRNLFSKVVNAIGCTVTGLRDIGRLVPMLTKLGGRHISYSVSEGYWEVLGRALDMTLRDILGEAYTQEVRRNWQMVYSFLSAVMLDGFRKARQAEASQGGAPDAPRRSAVAPRRSGARPSPAAH